MIRGLFSGLIWGGLFSAVVAVVMTQVGARVNVVRAAVPPVTVDPGSESAPVVTSDVAAQGERLATTPDVSEAARPVGGSEADAPVAGDTDIARPTPSDVKAEVAAQVESSPGAAPVADRPAVVPDTPEDPQLSDARDAPPDQLPDAPVETSAEQDAPDQPGAAPQPTELAALPDGSDTVDQPDLPEAPEVAALAPEVVPDSATPTAPDADVSGAVGEDPGVLDERPPALGNPVDTLPGVAGQPLAPAAPSAPGLEVARPILPDSPAPLPSEFGEEPDIEAGFEPAPDNPPPGEQAQPLPEVAVASSPGSVAGVVQNRLPRIGDPDPATAAAPDTTEQPAEAATDTAEADFNLAPASGALARYAAPYDAVEGQPVLSVVLIDDGGPSGDVARLPLAVTIAVPIGLPDAAARIAAFRAAGHEVVMIPNLQSGASRQDVASAMAQAQASAPESVALMDMPDQTFQRDRFVMNEVLISAASSGHGVIIHSGGLNTAKRLADQQSLPAAVVERDIDALSDDPAAILRALDQAEFQARQQGGAIVIGRTGAATIDSVAAWAAQLSAESVGLAPVSVVLRGGQGG